MRRFGRRLDVDALRAELPLTPFFFDLLHVDGQDLLDLPQRERFAALASRAPVGAASSRASSPPTPDEAAAFCRRAAARATKA